MNHQVRAPVVVRLRMLMIFVSACCAVALGAPIPALAQQDLVNQAHRLDLEGKQDAAIALYRQALERNPSSFDAHYGIARALDLTAGYEEARRHFAAAIELAPEGSKDQALRMMAISYVFTGDTNKAARYFRQVFDRDVAAGNVVAAADVANELGRVYLELGDLENAYKWYGTGYETAARQPSRSPSEIDLADLRWAHARARIAARKGDAQEAWRQTAAVKRLLDAGTNPDQQIQYPYLVGYVHFHLKEYDAAIMELQEADQEDPFIVVLLAEAYEKLGNIERAREYYRKSLTSNSHAVNNAFARRLARQKVQPTR